MKRSMNRVVVLVTLALVAGISQAETIEDTLEQTLAFAPGDRLEVSNTNGDIEVSAWDRNEIRIEARKRVKSSSEERARSAFDELLVNIEPTGDGVEIDTDYPRGRGSWWKGVSASVHFEIRLPSTADLSLETVNGKIVVRGVQGDLELGTTNGGIDVDKSGGRVSARTTNGGIDVEMHDVTVDESMSFRTTNGSITISLPAGIGADLTARTTNGSVQTDFPVTVQGTFKKNRLEGELNGGGATIDLKTTNGSIRIREL